MNLLQQLLGDQIFVWMMVFLRVGTAFSVMPTVGDAFVPTRARLLFALAVSVVVAPVIRPQLPAMPDSPFQLMVLAAGEMAVGIFLGTMARLLMGALEVAGTIISLQTGLSNAQIFNPALATAGSLPGALMGWLGLLLLFATDLHHLLIMAVVDSYATFLPGAPIPIDDMANVIGQLVSKSFLLGVQMSAPFIITGMLFALALGLLNKLAPQVQVFQLFTSVQVLLGLFMFALTLGAMMMFWLSRFESTFVDLLK
ncbi:flagellar biosynthetic protein FliR [Azospirillum picis]|uniref:Flagellar biosynthetic protein FliR n=1 Tax=Azospirillum picis TaxID=488438 RepID=A0ABU0MTJ9_9PROT|nr:flagellar biosynthetic protein FliR [Azospirillum picis]MBP2303033.1 flagellar biosynthetic protein FliR [Azospirillum picis]MDQ0536785.1 flagellar biosynthetic protein FliR [Azospirillum picis]